MFCLQRFSSLISVPLGVHGLSKSWPLSAVSQLHACERARPGRSLARNSMQVSHWGGRNPVTRTITTAFQGTQELNLESGAASGLTRTQAVGDRTQTSQAAAEPLSQVSRGSSAAPGVTSQHVPWQCPASLVREGGKLVGLRALLPPTSPNCWLRGSTKSQVCRRTLCFLVWRQYASMRQWQWVFDLKSNRRASLTSPWLSVG